MRLFLPDSSKCSSKFKVFISSLFTLLFVLSAKISQAQNPISGTFTINSTQPSNGTNFETVTEAVFALAYGVDGPVVFNVVSGSGPYQEQINLNEVPGASAINTITFNGNGETLQNESNNPLARAVLKLDGAKYFIIDNFIIKPLTTSASDSYGWGVGLIRDADNNIIRNCQIILGVGNSSSAQSNIGIYVGSTDDYPDSNGISDCDNNLIDNNVVIGGYYGINLDNYAGNFGFDFTTMDNNKITNNKITGFIHSGINLMWNKNTLIQGNEISTQMKESVVGINIDEKNSGLKINGNRIQGFTSNIAATETDFKGIKVSYSLSDVNNINVISNNIIYNITSNDHQTGIEIEGSAYYNVVHNTIILDGPGRSGKSTTGFKHGNTNMNVNFKNNIISIQRIGGSAQNALYIDDASNGFASDYNNVIVADGNNYGRYQGTVRATLSAWQTATGHDFHSSAIDPIFTDVSIGNYKPTNPAIDNMGTFVGIPFDILGEIKNNNTPDVGAYEFLTPPCNTPVAGGATEVIPIIAQCGGGLRTLTLSGNSFGTGQSYQWQTATTIDGTYSNIGPALVTPVFDIYPTTTLFYRATLTCGASSVTSEPLVVYVNQPMTGSYTINSALPSVNGNFKTFNDAVGAMKCGIVGPVVFTVEPGSGPYNEQVIFRDIWGINSTNTVTINGNGATIQYLSKNYNERAVIKLEGVQYFTIDNLNVVALAAASSDYGFGIQILNKSSYNTIKNCTVTVNKNQTFANLVPMLINSSGTESLGSNASYCDYNTVSNNTFIGGYYGVVLYSNANEKKMYHNKIIGNKIHDSYAYGIYALGTAHTLIDGNDIGRPTRAITGSTALNGIGFNNLSTSAVISNNKIHSTVAATPTATNTTVGILFNNCDALADSVNIVYNNVLYNFGGTGAQTALSNTSSDNIWYLHNTISMENKVGTPTSASRGFYQTTTATGIRFFNNNISISRSGTGINHGIYMNTPATTFAAKNNNYYISGSGTNYIGFRNSTQYSSVSTWQIGTSQDANALSINPQFIDVPNGNLSPTNLDLDNKGSFVDITTDINGIVRNSTTPDIGAYEFMGVLPVKLVSFSAIKTGNDVQVNWTTASELNTRSFTIQRSSDGLTFSNAGFVFANGNSNIQLQYDYKDLGAISNAISKNLYYRLLITDIDGAISYSPIVRLELKDQAKINIQVIPNPFVSNLYSNITTTTSGNVFIRVTDVAGRTLLQQTQFVNAGTTLINIDNVNKLPNAVYIVSIEINGNKFVQRLIK